MTITHAHPKAYTVAQRQKWDLSAPDLSGLHLNEADPRGRAFDVAMAFAVILFSAGAVWVMITKLPPAVLPTWLGMIAVYTVGRLSWDRLRHL